MALNGVINILKEGLKCIFGVLYVSFHISVSLQMQFKVIIMIIKALEIIYCDIKQRVVEHELYV